MEVLNPLLSRRFPPPSHLPPIHREQALQAGGHRFDPGTLHERTRWKRSDSLIPTFASSCSSLASGNGSGNGTGVIGLELRRQPGDGRHSRLPCKSFKTRAHESGDRPFSRRPGADSRQEARQFEANRPRKCGNSLRTGESRAASRTPRRFPSSRPESQAAARASPSPSRSFGRVLKLPIRADVE
jgi:hypothetical protein